MHPRHHVMEGFLGQLVPTARGLLEHLLVCERCRPAALAVLRGGPAAEQATEQVLAWPRAERRDRFPHRLLDAVEHRLREYEREQALAPTLAAELLGRPADERPALVAEHPRFRSLALATRLLEQSQRVLAEDSLAAESMTRLALEVARHLDADRYGTRVVEDVTARAWCYTGEALRRQGDLAAAEQAFGEAETLLSSTGDPLEEARFFELKARLLRDQRQFRGYRQLKERAAASLRRCSQESVETGIRC